MARFSVVFALALCLFAGCSDETETTEPHDAGPSRQELADQDCKAQESQSIAITADQCPAKFPDPVIDWMFPSDVDGFCCFCHSGQCPGIHPCREDIECGWCPGGNGVCQDNGLCGC